MQPSSDDQRILSHIQDLVSEEHQLQEQPTLLDAERARLAWIRVELDQSRDLLRQRRALREAGSDPNEAQLRPPKVVEKCVG